MIAYELFFPFFKANRNTLALAAAHEIIELDVSGLTDTDSRASDELDEKPKRMYVIDFLICYRAFRALSKLLLTDSGVDFTGGGMEEVSRARGRKEEQKCGLDIRHKRFHFNQQKKYKLRYEIREQHRT